MALKKYDVFLFDADGTLFDYNKAEANALKTMFGIYGLEYSEDIRLEYRNINEQVWKSYEKGDITKAELQASRFLRLFEYINVDLDANIFNEKYLTELGKGAFLIDGAFDICKEITSCGKRVYIVTNGIFATQKARIECSQIKDFISELFVSEHIGFPKPHISYFEHVFSHINQLDIAKTLIIGDSLTADIAGGNNAGIDSCWLNLSGEIKNNTNIMPTYEIHLLSELHKYINRKFV